MSLDHHLDGVRNDFPTGQGVTHPLVALAHAVTQGNGVELLCDTATFSNTVFGTFPQFAQMDMPGYDFVPGVHNGYQGFFEIFLFHSRGI